MTTLKCSDEQLMNWYRREIIPSMVKLQYYAWWRIVRLIHRGRSLHHVEACETADMLFSRDKMYCNAMIAWANREHPRGEFRSFSLSTLPRPLIKARMRKVGMIGG